MIINASYDVTRRTSMTSLMVAGVAITGTALLARILMRAATQMKNNASKLPKTPLLTSYYKGGFESKMSRREAALILGISPSSSKDRILTAHKKLIMLNHPDRGGSPYLAGKINEAKTKLEKAD